MPSSLLMTAISIHAPTRGATLASFIVLRNLIFQSTLLQEERRGLRGKYQLLVIFQSTLLQEERLKPPYRNSIRPPFQSTLLQEERLNALNSGVYSNNFNPRSYKRSDLLHDLGKMGDYDFNPRSYKRSDLLHDLGKMGDYDFNPRSYKRSDYRT